MRFRQPIRRTKTEKRRIELDVREGYHRSRGHVDIIQPERN